MHLFIIFLLVVPVAFVHTVPILDYQYFSPINSETPVTSIDGASLAASGADSLVPLTYANQPSIFNRSIQIKRRGDG